MSQQWTTDQPTQPGLYWAYENLDPLDADVMIAKVVMSPNLKRLVVLTIGDECVSALNDFSHWMQAEYPAPPEVSQ